MAFFFAMRSCEYFKVPQPEQHRTDILRLGDIRFFKDGVNNVGIVAQSECKHGGFTSMVRLFIRIQCFGI
jgi:hypothetical protein